MNRIGQNFYLRPSYGFQHLCFQALPIAGSAIKLMLFLSEADGEDDGFGDALHPDSTAFASLQPTTDVSCVDPLLLRNGYNPSLYPLFKWSH